jgi:hypothetical protein
MRNRIRTGWFGLLFLLSEFSVSGQELMLKSRVLDIQTGETLPFANIMLLNRNIGTTADIGGAFAFT